MEITENEISIILNILKSPEKDFNANNLSKVIGISSMGVLKILKRLKEENILIDKKIGNISIYKINFSNEYANSYTKFLIKREKEHSPPYVKRWIKDLKEIKEVESIVIFGSVLKKLKKAEDIDVLFILKDINFNKVKKRIQKLNQINDKKIHPLYQNKEDLKKNINKEDKIISSAIKGIVINGEETFIELLK
jgi:predicted nucleotidyltransferase